MSDDMLACLDDEAPIAERADSFRKQIGSLKVGESAAKVKRVVIDTPEAANLALTIKKVRQSVDAEASKQRKATGRSYEVQQASVVLSEQHIMIVVAVTRI